MWIVAKRERRSDKSNLPLSLSNWELLQRQLQIIVTFLGDSEEQFRSWFYVVILDPVITYHQ